MPRPLIRLAAVAAVLPVLLAACGTDSDDDPTIALPEAPASTSAASGVRVVPAAEGLALAAADGTVVLDVRTPQEYAAGHLTGARNVALGDSFAAEMARLPRDGAYVVYCASGNRSAQAAQIMAELGFRDVADAGGLQALAAAGGRVVT